LIHSNQELSGAYDRTLEGWASALELRDHETQGHTERVTQLAARVFSIVDVLPYRISWGKQEALNYIVLRSGKHFDPRLVDVFTRRVEVD